MFSCARIGLPAATWPTSGTPPSAFNRMPRDVPGTRSRTPFFASTLRCCSAAFGELKPKCCAISARVGGRPVVSIHSRIRFRISSWRRVRSRMGLPPNTVCMYSIVTVCLYSIKTEPVKRQYAGRTRAGKQENPHDETRKDQLPRLQPHEAARDFHRRPQRPTRQQTRQKAVRRRPGHLPGQPHPWPVLGRPPDAPAVCGGGCGGRGADGGFVGSFLGLCCLSFVVVVGLFVG